MKTLDEVIEMAEHCWKPMPEGICDTCPSRQRAGNCQLLDQALQYLKEYRDKAHRLDIDIAEHHRTFEQLGVEIARYQEAVKNCETAENRHKAYELGYIRAMADYEELKRFWAESQTNPPLTWDELKGMEGKPVWVEGYRGNKWIIVGAFPCWMEDAFADSVPNIWWRKENLGKTWQAYRKERE